MTLEVKPLKSQRSKLNWNEARIDFTRYQALLGNACPPSSAWQGALIVIKLGQKFSKRSFGCRHYQAELGSELTTPNQTHSTIVSDFSSVLRLYSPTVSLIF
jgi:hypothetical protein